MAKHLRDACLIILAVAGLPFVEEAAAQFRDDFDNAALTRDSSANNGWAFYTGDGAAIMDFQAGEGHASILVDATNDRRNIWWALIRRRVSSDFDLNKLLEPEFELRLEARIRVSHAPRRVNLHLNTQRTTDFHSHLMEFDIPDTNNWHTISMTTHGFDAAPGDSVYGQLALMDWGLARYRVDIDYFKVDIVNTESASADKGMQVPYRPPIPALDTFAHHLAAAHDAMIDRDYPGINFNNWCAQEENGRVEVLAVSGTQTVIMRWDLRKFETKTVAGAGVLELTTYAVQRASDNLKDFGMVRVVEILGGEPDWNQTTVTEKSLRQDRPWNEVFNPQLIVDFEVKPGRGSRNLVTISQPVLQRIREGKTLGLALQPLGAVQASFYASEYQKGKFAARLHFNVEVN